MDREAWYSVTPEPIARYLAMRAIAGRKPLDLQDDEAMSVDEKIPVNVLDAFGGVGGNVI
jgi:hypothetical protein